jgi:hypothetical protein
MDKKRVVFELDKDLHHRLKVATAQRGETISDVMRRAAVAYLDNCVVERVREVVGE